MNTVGRHAGRIGPAAGFMARLPAHERDLLMNSSVRCTFQHGESLFGVDNDRFAGVVTSGMVRVCRPLADGRQASFRIVGVDGLIGLGALVRRGDLVLGEAVGPAAVVRLDLRVVHGLTLSSPSFSFAIAQEIHARLVETTALVELRMRGNLRRRLALELHDLAGASGTSLGAAIAVTHEALAHGLGTSREVVGRLLHTFVAESLVYQLAPGRLEVLDPVRLLTLALG